MSIGIPCLIFLSSFYSHNNQTIGSFDHTLCYQQPTRILLSALVALQQDTFPQATRLHSTCFPHVFSTDFMQQDCAFAPRHDQLVYLTLLANKEPHKAYKNNLSINLRLPTYL